MEIERVICGETDMEKKRVHEKKKGAWKKKG